MAIYRDERKSIWTRKNEHHQQGTVDLVIENETFMAIRHSQSPNQILLTKSQLYEMASKAAIELGEEIVVKTPARSACQNCGGFNFGYWQDNEGFQKYCRDCYLSGPITETKAASIDAWDRIFPPGFCVKQPEAAITTEEELQRR